MEQGGAPESPSLAEEQLEVGGCLRRESVFLRDVSSGPLSVLQWMVLHPMYAHTLTGLDELKKKRKWK